MSPITPRNTPQVLKVSLQKPNPLLSQPPFFLNPCLSFQITPSFWTFTQKGPVTPLPRTVEEKQNVRRGAPGRIPAPNPPGAPWGTGTCDAETAGANPGRAPEMLKREEKRNLWVYCTVQAQHRGMRARGSVYTPSAATGSVCALVTERLGELLSS